MKKLFKTTLLTTALMGALSTIAIAQQPAASNPAVVAEESVYVLQDPVAKINGREVSKSEFENYLLLSQGVQADAVENKELAEQLVLMLGTQEALAQEAIKRGLNKDTDYQMKVKLIGDLFLSDLLFQDMVKKGQISEKEIKAQYEAAVAQLEKQEYEASHILVETEEEAQAIIDAINKEKTPEAKKALFAKDAKEKSLDTATAERDGSIGGWFRLSMMDPSFGEALKTMKKGEMSQKPVQSQFGYHVIILDDVRDLDIKPFADLDEATKLQLAQPLFQEYVNKIQKGVKVELPAEKK